MKGEGGRGRCEREGKGGGRGRGESAGGCVRSERGSTGQGKHVPDDMLYREREREREREDDTLYRQARAHTHTHTHIHTSVRSLALRLSLSHSHRRTGANSTWIGLWSSHELKSRYGALRGNGLSLVKKHCMMM